MVNKWCDQVVTSTWYDVQDSFRLLLWGYIFPCTFHLYRQVIPLTVTENKSHYVPCITPNYTIVNVCCAAAIYLALCTTFTVFCTILDFFCLILVHSVCTSWMVLFKETLLSTCLLIPLGWFHLRIPLWYVIASHQTSFHLRIPLWHVHASCQTSFHLRIFLWYAPCALTTWMVP